MTSYLDWIVLLSVGMLNSREYGWMKITNIIIVVGSSACGWIECSWVGSTASVLQSG